jgi:hypothetical protein
MLESTKFRSQCVMWKGFICAAVVTLVVVSFAMSRLAD